MANKTQEITVAEFLEMQKKPGSPKATASETDIMRSIRDFLRLHGWMVVRIHQSLGSEREMCIRDREKTREDLEKTGYTGFHKDEKGLFLYDYQVMGFIKEAGNTLKDQLKIKNLRSKLNMFVYVAPRRIHFAKEPSEP